MKTQIAFAEKVKVLRKNFYDGGSRQIAKRKRILKDLLKLLLEHRQEIFEALKVDLNKSESEAISSELSLLMPALRQMIRNVKGWSRAKRVYPGIYNTPGGGRLYPEPYGVVLVAGTWNYPFLLTLEPLFGAIAAGNCVVLKLPESAESSACLMNKIITKLNVPEVISIATESWEELLSVRYDMIFFTGGERMGRLILRKASETLTPAVLELGGKSPCIVTENANLDVAARRIVWGKFMNAGQTCVAPDYLLVQSSVKDKLTRKMRKYVQEFYGLEPKDSPDFGRIISDFHFKRLCGLLSEGRLICGGEHDNETKYIAPTIVDMIDWESQVMQQEIFGPILPIMEFDSLEQVLYDLKLKHKPLALYLFSNKRKEWKQVMQESSSGSMAINETIMQLAAPKLPFGGVGNSGMGSYHGKRSFEAFSHYKAVLIKPTWIEFALRFPPFAGWKSSIIRMCGK